MHRRVPPFGRRAIAAIASLAMWSGAAWLTPTIRALPQGGPPFSPPDALDTLRVEDGLHVELFAHEPDTMSPVAMDVDEDGRVFVVEMPGYPLDTSASGRIRLLEDVDGDGRIDRSTVFADGLVLPTGVMRWKQGILVTAAPDVLYLEDSDGDGHADIRRVVLTGFARTNPQHRVNTPVYGLDNWITLAHEGPAEAVIFKEQFGDPGGPLRFPDEGGRVALEPRPRSIRFTLDPRRIEARSGSSQYGHAFDAWGHYFTLNNSNHARHEVIAARYLERNPDLVIERAMKDVSDHGDAAEVFPITRRPQFEMLSEVGQITSACSLTFELGGAWPARFAGSAFVAEPVHNLVHRDRYEPSGPTFIAHRGLEHAEFLASTDPWFRPVNLYLGPDGALFVVDYYRPLIEHPEWTASDRHVDSPELYVGKDCGRLYRVVPEGAKLDEWPRPGRLRRAGDAELVERLGHRNAWWRRTAQRLLVDRRSEASLPLLERAVRERRSALSRLHALWTLEGLGRLSADLVTLALADPEPGVRENAIRLAEPVLTSRLVPAATDAVRAALVTTLIGLTADPDARVRFQLLATLGDVDTPQARAAHERLLLAHVDDEWMQVAGLSAPSERAVALLTRGLSAVGVTTQPSKAVATGETSKELPGRALFFERLASIVAARGRSAEIDSVIRVPGSPGDPAAAWWRAALLRGLARGVAASRGGRDAVRVRQAEVLRLFEEGGPTVRRAALGLVIAAGFAAEPWTAPVIARAARTARSIRANEAARVDALGLIRLSGPAAHETLLRELVVPREPESVQSAAIEALSALPGDDIGRFLLERWGALTPGSRHAAAHALTADIGRTRLLLQAMAKGSVPSWTLSFWEKRDSVMHDDAAIRAEARGLLEERPAERQAVVARYAAALDLQGDAARGREVFTRVCAACHRLDQAGVESVGPDLATVRHRPLSALLADILLPSQSIAQRYETYVIERVSGGVETGVLGGQTPTSVTLRIPGREILVARRDIKTMRVVPQSAMPAELDRVIDPQQMADLLRFIVDGR